MSIKFRSFTQDDYSELLSMVLELYSEDPEGEPITKEKIRNTISELNRNSSKGEIYVFEKDNEIIGYSILIFYWSNEFGGNILNIDELYMKENWRNQGICTRFLNKIFKKFSNTVAAFQLEVSPSNERVRNYYLRLGFSKAENLHLIKKVN